MSGPYRPPRCRGGHASGSRHRQWVRGQDSQPPSYQQSTHQSWGEEYDSRYQGYSSQYQDGYAYGAHGAGYYDSYPAEYYQQQAYQDPYYSGTQGYVQGFEGWATGRGEEWRGNGNGWDAQNYPPPHRYGAHSAHAAATHSPIAGAPDAPKKMRQAAQHSQHSQYGCNQHPSSSSSSPYHPQMPAHPSLHQPHYQQQRDHHTNSRYQPYTHDNNSSAPSDPSAHFSGSAHFARNVPAPRFLAPSIRSSPRDSYILQATQPSLTLDHVEVATRKLLVILDLNGTLVFRAKRANGRALDSVRAVPRPYLLCFLRYCLGSPPSSSPTPHDGSAQQAEERPHGSHFWSSTTEPQSQGKAEVVVWSSAQPLNVDSMVKASFDQSVRAQIKRVWARDTLVPNRLFGLKADSVKDLEIVWAELNAHANGRPSPGRLLAEVRDELDRERPDDVVSAPTSPAAGKKYKGKKAKRTAGKEASEGGKISAALEAAQEAQKLGPWGPHNTVLVDDSVAKARLQPYNQLVIPEFGKKDAGMMRKYILQQLPSDTAQEAAEAELEYDSDLSIPDKAQPITNDAEGDETMHIQEAEEGFKEKNAKKPIPESRLDDVLLQTIGVLSILRYQSNVSSFIRAGGIKGYGEAKTALNEKQRQEKVEQGNTPEYWAQMGKEACEQAGIQVKAWVPGEAASATAALL